MVFEKSFAIIDLTMVYIDICYIKWYNEIIKEESDYLHEDCCL